MIRKSSRTSASGSVDGAVRGLAHAGLAVAPAVDAAPLEPVQRMLSPLLRLAGAQGAAVRWLAPVGDGLLRVAALGPGAADCRGGSSATRDCGFCADAIDGGQLQWSTDLRPCAPQTVAVALPGTRPQPFAGGGRRMLTLPLFDHDRVLGVCNLLFDADAAEPAPELRTLLEPLGELLGWALGQAGLDAQKVDARLHEERQLMAAEIHDSVAQSLTFVKLRLPLLHDAVLSRDELRARGYLDELRAETSEAQASLRGILTRLRAPTDPVGLEQALGSSAERFRRRSGAELEFVNELPGLRLSPGHESEVFNIVQEALTNVVRHASARHARLHIAAARDGGVQIVVDDDGTGIAAAARGQAGHHGMDIMRERARRIGGTLEVGARLGGGTRVRLAFPVSAAAAAPAIGSGAH